MQPFEDQFDRRGKNGRMTAVDLVTFEQRIYGRLQRRDFLEQSHIGVGAYIATHVGGNTLLERVDDRAVERWVDRIDKRRVHRRADERVDNSTLASVLERLDLDLPRGRRGDCSEIPNAWHSNIIAGRKASTNGVRDDSFVVGDAQADRHSRTLIDLAGLPRLL